MAVKVKGIVWLGIKTDKFQEMQRFFEQLFNLEQSQDETNFKIFNLPNGDRIELFSPDYPNHNFTTGPVVGFQVDNIEEAKREMEKYGIHFISDILGDLKRSQWIHFQGPDGNIYELTTRKDSETSSE